MKKTLMTVAAVAAMIGFAGQDDLLVTISAKEQLLYANTQEKVCDELVALVWTPKTAAFAGFYADGSTVDAASKVLARIPVKDGRFQTTTFQISATLAEEMKLADGTFSLYLLDTRGADGKAVGSKSESGFKSGVVPVNYFARIVEGQVAGSAAGSVGSITSEGSADGVIVASGVAQLPVAEAELKPIVKTVKVENGMFKVTIEKAVPYLKYGLKTGSEPGKFADPTALTTPLTETVTLEAPATAPSGFCCVTAARNQ